jgi:hypothetical protein
MPTPLLQNPCCLLQADNVLVSTTGAHQQLCADATGGDKSPQQQGQCSRHNDAVPMLLVLFVTLLADECFMASHKPKAYATLSREHS